MTNIANQVSQAQFFAINPFFDQKLQNHTYRTKILSQAIDIELNLRESWVIDPSCSANSSMNLDEKIAIQELDLEFQKDSKYLKDRKYIIEKIHSLIERSKMSKTDSVAKLFMSKTHRFLSNDTALIYDKIGGGFSDLIYYKSGKDYYVIIPSEVGNMPRDSFDVDLMYKLPEKLFQTIN